MSPAGPLSRPNRLPRADEPGRYVYCSRPRCPQCNNPELHPYRSQRNGDGTLTRYTNCPKCGAKFIVVLE